MAYHTTDLYLAAFLSTRGHPIHVVRITPTRSRFDFPDGAEVDALSYSEGGTVSAPLFADALRRLKRLVGAQREAQRGVAR